jgi:hypothetical protein
MNSKSMKFKIGDYVQTIKGDRLSNIKKKGIVIGFTYWRDFPALKIKTNGDIKNRITILEKNAILLKPKSKNDKMIIKIELNTELAESIIEDSLKDMLISWKKYNVIKSSKINISYSCGEKK